MQLFHLHARRRRSAGATVVFLLALGWLAVNLFQTQVLKNSTFELQSDRNRLRPVPVPAPRGAILDRNGQIIAESIPGYTLSLLPGPVDSLRAMLWRLAPILELDSARIETLLARQRRTPHQPLVVSRDLTFDQISVLEEQRPRFPGILIEPGPKRSYPDGPAVAHLVGYISEISEAELAMPEFEGYTQGQIIGKVGIERMYETRLGGEPGVRYVEVDALGRLVGDFAAARQIDPVPGEPLRLTIDLDLQRFIHQIFPDSMRGAIVALEPGTGHVLAMYSAPSYDPNEFVGGISAELWRELNQDPARPLLPRATAGRYPPGSTYKLATAAVALELGYIDPDGYLPIPCRGGMSYGNRYFRCWYAGGHGSLDLYDAIARSCNVYFYQAGLRVGLEQFLRVTSRLGFTERTGIDLPDEVAGIYPTDANEWYRRRWGWAATPTEVLSLAIGQGANDQTVLRMAHFFAALAADGKAPPPRLALDSARISGRELDLGLSPSTLAALREGLRRTALPRGTAHLASLEHWELAGKTGTAQNPHGPSHGWFVGMAGPWGGEPEIVVAAIIEAGESGSNTAQYAAKAADYYLRKKYGIPVDTIQTLREHLNTGTPAPWARW